MKKTKRANNCIYLTDDLYKFNTLEEALKHSKDNEECTKITKKELYNFDDRALKESVVWVRESKPLTERKWDYVLKSGVALRRAIQDEDIEGIRQGLIDCYNELFENDLIDEYERDEWVEEVEDADFAGEYNDDFFYGDYDEDLVDYELDQLYDLCDNINVFVALDEALEKGDTEEAEKLEKEQDDLYDEAEYCDDHNNPSRAVSLRNQANELQKKINEEHIEYSGPENPEDDEEDEFDSDFSIGKKILRTIEKKIKANPNLELVNIDTQEYYDLVRQYGLEDNKHDLYIEISVYKNWTRDGYDCYRVECSAYEGQEADDGAEVYVCDTSRKSIKELEDTLHYYLDDFDDLDEKCGRKVDEDFYDRLGANKIFVDLYSTGDYQAKLKPEEKTVYVILPKKGVYSKINEKILFSGDYDLTSGTLIDTNPQKTLEDVERVAKNFIKKYNCKEVDVDTLNKLDKEDRDYWTKIIFNHFEDKKRNESCSRRNKTIKENKKDDYLNPKHTYDVGDTVSLYQLLNDDPSCAGVIVWNGTDKSRCWVWYANDLGNIDMEEDATAIITISDTKPLADGRYIYFHIEDIDKTFPTDYKWFEEMDDAIEGFEEDAQYRIDNHKKYSSKNESCSKKQHRRKLKESRVSVSNTCFSNKGLSDNEIFKRREEINKNYRNNGAYTEEEEQELGELYARDTITSSLAYNIDPEKKGGVPKNDGWGGTYGNDISKIDVMATVYSDLYHCSLNKLKELVKQQKERLSKARINKNVGTDSEGVLYNSVDWDIDESKKSKKNAKESFLGRPRVATPIDEIEDEFYNEDIKYTKEYGEDGETIFHIEDNGGDVDAIDVADQIVCDKVGDRYDRDRDNGIITVYAIEDDIDESKSLKEDIDDIDDGYEEIEFFEGDEGDLDAEDFISENKDWLESEYDDYGYEWDNYRKGYVVYGRYEDDGYSKTFDNIPTYANTYMAYGDVDNDLTDEDIENIDKFMEENNLVSLISTSDSTYFCSDPAFGEACDCFEWARFSVNNELGESKKSKKKKDKVRFVGDMNKEISFFNRAMGNQVATADGGVGSVAVAEGIEDVAKELEFDFDKLAKRCPYIADSYVDGNKIIINTNWRTTPRKVESDRVDLISWLNKKLGKDTYTLKYISRESRDNGNEFSAKLELTLKDKKPVKEDKTIKIKNPNKQREITIKDKDEDDLGHPIQKGLKGRLNKLK